MVCATQTENKSIKTTYFFIQCEHILQPILIIDRVLLRKKGFRDSQDQLNAATEKMRNNTDDLTEKRLSRLNHYCLINIQYFLPFFTERTRYNNNHNFNKVNDFFFVPTLCLHCV